MAYTVDVNSLVATGYPVLFWVDAFAPFNIGQDVVAHSGRVAMVKTEPNGLEGRPMTINFRMAKKTHLDGWKLLVDADPFNTTSLSSYFDTGYKVVFAVQNPIAVQNEVIREYDINQNIFVSGHARYRKGFDHFRGTLNLVITGTY
jgi:hypothetical protein